MLTDGMSDSPSGHYEPSQPTRSDPRMTNSQRLANVRVALQHWLARHVESPAGEVAPAGSLQRLGSESILIRGGFYCGRRFDAGTHHAVWFVEEDELKIYELSGQLVCSMQADEISHWVSQTPPVPLPSVSTPTALPAVAECEPAAAATEISKDVAAAPGTFSEGVESNDEPSVLSMNSARLASPRSKSGNSDSSSAEHRVADGSGSDHSSHQPADAHADQSSRRAA